MSESQRKKMIDLDEAAEKAKGYVSPVSDQNVHYDYRKIARYCKQKGIEPVDMTIRELNQFVVND